MNKARMMCSLHRIAVKQGTAFDRYATGIRVGNRVRIGFSPASPEGRVQRIYQRRCDLFVRVKLDSGKIVARRANTTRRLP
jgi:hypothetical protein